MEVHIKKIEPQYQIINTSTLDEPSNQRRFAGHLVHFTIITPTGNVELDGRVTVGNANINMDALKSNIREHFLKMLQGENLK